MLNQMKSLAKPPKTLHRTSKSLNNVPCRSCDRRRFVHDGALPGGFSKEALSQWAHLTWKNEDDSSHTSNGRLNRRRNTMSYDEDDLDGQQRHYVDLFSEKISLECTEYLKHQIHPSSDLTKCFFGSYRFLPERCVLTPFFHNHSTLPNIFSSSTRFLAWTVKVDTPLETICTWEFYGFRGCTMVGFDPSLRRVYHGNCIHFSATKSALFIKLLPVHERYACFLLNGMVYEIEKQSQVTG